MYNRDEHAQARRAVEIDGGGEGTRVAALLHVRPSLCASSRRRGCEQPESVHMLPYRGYHRAEQPFVTSARNVLKGRRLILASEDRLRAQILAEALREQEARVGVLRLPLGDRSILVTAELLLVDTQSGPTLQAAVQALQLDALRQGPTVRTLDFRTIVGEDGCARLSLLEDMVVALTTDRALTERPKRPLPPLPTEKRASSADVFTEVPTKAAAYRLTPSFSETEDPPPVKQGEAAASPQARTSFAEAEEADELEPDTDPSGLLETPSAPTATRAAAPVRVAPPPPPVPGSPAVAIDGRIKPDRPVTTKRSGATDSPVRDESPVGAESPVRNDSPTVRPDDPVRAESPVRNDGPVEAEGPALPEGPADAQQEAEAFVESVSPTAVHANEFRKRRRFGLMASLSGAAALAAALGIGYLTRDSVDTAAPPHAATRPAAVADPLGAARTPTPTPLAQPPVAAPQPPASKDLQAGEDDGGTAPQPAASAQNPSTSPEADQPPLQQGPAAAAEDSAEPRDALPVEVPPVAPEAQAAATPEDLIRDANKLLARDPGEAQRMFEAAIALAPKNPHAHAGLGQALLALDQPAAAQAALEDAIRLRPKRALYRVLLGDVLKRAGKLDEAREAWTKAHELDPSDADARKRLGMDSN